ncbi:MAG: hypothetical protein D6B25_15135 [Desulfobulbaceae bacterium]|nr:MAG: hypothetical protein D6B25_15135 [Desulfobulbaceae bacterium]
MSENQEQELQVMVWYPENQYDEIKELCADTHLLPPTYEAWLKMAEEMVKKVENSGDLVAKVTLDKDIFVAWCKEKGKTMDAEARTLFAIEAIQKQQFLNSM